MAVSIVSNLANSAREQQTQVTTTEREVRNPVNQIQQVNEVDSGRQAISPSEIENLVIDANNLVSGTSQLRFRLSESGDYPTVIQIIDPDTKEVIKEIPPEYIQKIISGLKAGEFEILNEQA